ncbi:MAG: Lrp/AsnC family transcriptional regulator [Fimbriimonadaceae bacterium]|nr:Lrp/AsnC family transcriptional regulator [Fimbriimonadaceae bacterium]
MSKTHLDEVDVELLRLLQSDGRITNADLAKQVNLSPPSVLQRVRALEKAGAIKGYAAILDGERLGFRITAWVQITLSLHQEQPIERFRRAIQEIPEILECHHVSGDFDFLLKVTVRDMRQYEVFVREKLSKIKGIQQIRSSFAMATNKHTTALPLG